MEKRVAALILLACVHRVCTADQEHVQLTAYERYSESGFHLLRRKIMDGKCDLDCIYNPLF